MGALSGVLLFLVVLTLWYILKAQHMKRIVTELPIYPGAVIEETAVGFLRGQSEAIARYRIYKVDPKVEYDIHQFYVSHALKRGWSPYEYWRKEGDFSLFNNGKNHFVKIGAAVTCTILCTGCDFARGPVYTRVQGREQCNLGAIAKWTEITIEHKSASIALPVPNAIPFMLEKLRGCEHAVTC